MFGWLQDLALIRDQQTDILFKLEDIEHRLSSLKRQQDDHARKLSQWMRYAGELETENRHLRAQLESIKE